MVRRPARHPWEFSEDTFGEVAGKWEFSCGDPSKGFQLLEDAAKRYPDSSTIYGALEEYYDSQGEPEKAREAAKKSSRLYREWERRASQ